MIEKSKGEKRGRMKREKSKGENETACLIRYVAQYLLLCVYMIRQGQKIEPV